MAGVRILGSSKVRARLDDSLPPSSSTHLSFFDVWWLSLQPMKIVLLYPDAAISPASFDSFKSSLSLILPRFYLLAGDLTYQPTTGEVTIVCSDESGVTVTEAESDLDIRCLAGEPKHDMDSFFKLVPDVAHEELPVPILSVQFTRFTCGGVAVGIALHHVAMDGMGTCKFIDSWAKTCSDGSVPSGINLLHDRALIKYPNMDGLKNETLMDVAPNLPKIIPYPAPDPDRKQLFQRSFTLDATTIQVLKQRAMQEKGATQNSSPPTTFEVLAAHIWISIARAMGITSENNKPTFLFSFLDGRPFLPPPMSSAYTGNCLFNFAVASSGSRLMAADGFGRTCECISETVYTTKDVIKRGNKVNLGSLDGIKVSIAGSNRLGVYGADFGWGKPSWMLHASLHNDGEVVIVAGKEKGTVQITVKLNYEAMEEFVNVFSKGLYVTSKI
ncbi:HXXXD-type acyl-transferase family protein [Rhynchospora pubera]|uniref:HXXXD-type acyl-transferase family protein n=1 Tax=Rhynchospora pubera TaxID=906938 RepID=A0AAV8AJU9_9POAL|nr:HXXXD-type acyl-transferase family protein [Rhynchospora pubera]KAJ4788280.1 HXXXD-type acyl-transferase family protein [Rhynchospora pubera]